MRAGSWPSTASTSRSNMSNGFSEIRRRARSAHSVAVADVWHLSYIPPTAPLLGSPSAVRKDRKEAEHAHALHALLSLPKYLASCAGAQQIRNQTG